MSTLISPRSAMNTSAILWWRGEARCSAVSGKHARVASAAGCHANAPLLAADRRARRLLVLEVRVSYRQTRRAHHSRGSDSIRHSNDLLRRRVEISSDYVPQDYQDSPAGLPQWEARGGGVSEGSVSAEMH
jgi:hypothetical protein